MMRMMATATQYPTQRDKNGGQRQGYPNARQDIFSNPRAGQAVGQGVQDRIVDAVTREIVTGIQRDV